MFNDGNGRTSRFLYDLFKRDKTKEEISQDVCHDKFDGRLVNNFAINNGIDSEYEIATNINNVLKQKLINEGILPNDKHFARKIRTFRMTRNIIDLESKDIDFFPKSFSEADKRKLLRILDDNNGDSSTIGGLTVAAVLHKRGTLQKAFADADSFRDSWKDEPDVYAVWKTKISFKPDDIADWTAEDFSYAFKIGEYIKLKEHEVLLDIYSNPNKALLKNCGYSDDYKAKTTYSDICPISESQNIQIVETVNLVDDSKPSINASGILKNARISKKPIKSIGVFMTDKSDNYIGRITANVYDDGSASMMMFGMRCAPLPENLEKMREHILKDLNEDVAFLVEDKFKHQGQGKVLINELFKHLSEQGVHTVKVSGIAGDIAMVAYLRTGATQNGNSLTATYNNISEINVFEKREFEIKHPAVNENLRESMLAKARLKFSNGPQIDILPGQ